AGAPERIRTASEEDQSHAVTCGRANDLVAGSGVGHRGTIVDDVLQAAENGGLPIERKSRVTDRIQEENVRPFGLVEVQRRHGCSDKEQRLPVIAIRTEEYEAPIATSGAMSLCDASIRCCAGPAPSIFYFVAGAFLRRMISARLRSELFTASAFGKILATSGSNTTTLLPRA